MAHDFDDVRDRWQDECSRLKAALRNISALEPGSRGAYHKFSKAQQIAREALGE